MTMMIMYFVYPSPSGDFGFGLFEQSSWLVVVWCLLSVSFKIALEIYHRSMYFFTFLSKV